MAELVAGACVGAVISEAYNALSRLARDAVSKVVWCKKYCQALANDLDANKATLLQIFSRVQMPATEWEQRSLMDFKATLDEGKELVESCIKLKSWHPIQRYRYSKNILKLRQKFLQHLKNLVPFNTLQLQQIQASLDITDEHLDQLRQLVDPLVAATTSGNTTLILDIVRKLANDVAGSTLLPQHVEGQSTSQTSVPVGKPLDHDLQRDQFLVGLDDPICQLKRLLLSGDKEKIVTIAHGTGGIGKTALVLALIRKDPQVREFFEERIYFFTVSQNPDMMALLSNIWLQVFVGEAVPRFQNEEDACSQLKKKLECSIPAKPRLLVFDDMWSRSEILENILFEGEGIKALITTRHASALESRHSQTYKLDLLSEENAQSLFCYWAFGQVSIPPWANESVVKEVISECNGLPLALKVIGTSLFNARHPMIWCKARDKLRNSEPLEGNVLWGRLQTSIDALDPRLQECFLDLGAFPEDTKCSVDTLLDIWVYVRGMEWVDAVLSLAELGSRCLLNLDQQIDSCDAACALQYGSAGSLAFSQHDIMRDLALSLGRKDRRASERSRLLMPQKKQNIPEDWLVEPSLGAQIISIHTGAMKEQDWPCTLTFPCAEALLLYFDGNDYHLPPFVKSMCELKVMFISSSKPRHRIVGSLEGLSDQLQSLGMENVALNTAHPAPKLKKLRLKGIPDAAGVLYTLKEQDWASLRVLFLWKNEQSALPDNCCQLHSLQLLSLQGCERLCELPKDLGKLTNLVCLSLWGCRSLNELPASLCNLVRLEVLEIKNCYKVKNLPENLGLLTALKELYLLGSNLVSYLPESLGNLCNLKTLYIAPCHNLRHLPRTFGELAALKKLHLIGCHSLEDLPDNFELLRSLEDLELRHCKELIELPQNFGQLRNLKSLSLRGCSKLKCLPKSFVELHRLTTLNLSDCSELDTSSFKQLPTIIPTLLITTTT